MIELESVRRRTAKIKRQKRSKTDKAWLRALSNNGSKVGTLRYKPTLIWEL